MTTQSLALLSVLLIVTPPVQSQDTTWTLPLPDGGSLVWIKLPSGEWLAGHVKSLRDRDLEFDSEELDELSSTGTTSKS